MNIITINVCLLIAWLMILGGAVLALGIGAGMIAGGVTLVALSFLAARAAGGFYSSRAGESR